MHIITHNICEPCESRILKVRLDNWKVGEEVRSGWSPMSLDHCITSVLVIYRP